MQKKHMRASSAKQRLIGDLKNRLYLNHIVAVFSFVSPIDCYIGLQLLEVGVRLTFFLSLSSCLPCLTILGDYY